MIVFLKAHPVVQAAASGTATPDLIDGDVRRNPGEPSPAQAESGNYKKPAMKWMGLTIRIENPAGSVRRGPWGETRMKCDYGYVSRSEGVDGDEVDVYIGSHANDAPMVYVVHQRKYGDWKAYDEDKCMIGFLSQEEAESAYLAHYDDPRFLGPVTAMPVEEFVEKVKATNDKPAMIKGMVVFLKALPSDSSPSVGDRIEFMSDRHTDKGPSSGTVTGAKITVDGLYLKIKHSDEERLFSWDDIREGAERKGDLWLIKSHVDGHKRRTASGKVVFVKPYNTKVMARGDGDGQLDMFAPAGGGDMPGIWQDDVQRERLRAAGIRWANHEKGEYGTDWMRENLAAYFEDRWHVPRKFTQPEIDKWFPSQDKGESSDTYTMPKKEAVAEHKRLVAVLRSPSHADDKVEAKKQAEELEEINVAPKAEDFPSAASYHTAMREWRSANGKNNVPSASPGDDSSRIAGDISRKIGLAEKRLAQQRKKLSTPGAVPAVVIHDAIRGIEREISRLREQLRNVAPVAPPKSAPTPEDQADPRRKYYVTMVRDPGPRQRVAWLAGPFDRHDDALEHVDEARRHAEEADPRASFDSFGTTGVVADRHPPGVLNGKMGVGKPATAPLMEGDKFHTVSGRITGPFPKTSYKRESMNELNLRQWLKEEAVAEAKSRGDKFNLAQFESLNPKNWSQSDGDSVNLYLFDDVDGRIGHRKVKNIA